MTELRPIRSDDDHAAALAMLAELWGARDDTPEGDRLDVLATLIDAYERERHPVPLPDPIAAIAFHMEQNGLVQKDLAVLLGSRSRASEILARKRRLTIEVIWKLHKEWGLPAEVLIQPYALASAAA